MNQTFYDALVDCPVIAAIKDDEGLEKCLGSDIQIVFILHGDIVSLGRVVERLKEAGKFVIVHVDLIAGLSGKEIAVDFIKKNTKADGNNSTKMPLIKRGKELGMVTVFRFFVIDSMAFDNIKKQYDMGQPDLVEILPGIMPKIITKMTQVVSAPVIAGGLIAEKSDVIAAIEAGAIAISSTNQKIWFI
ncbi:MAG: glycerol-3-phosphate responsive antiterminator [Clostridium sp.]